MLDGFIFSPNKSIHQHYGQGNCVGIGGDKMFTDDCFSSEYYYICQLDCLKCGPDKGIWFLLHTIFCVIKFSLEIES